MTIRQYRKKPMVITAVRLGWDTWGDMCEHAVVGRLVDGRPQGGFIRLDGTIDLEGDGGGTDAIGLAIPTLEGLMVATEGDWVIRGVKGELYPCKPDIFALTYEEVGHES